MGHCFQHNQHLSLSQKLVSWRKNTTSFFTNIIWIISDDPGVDLRNKGSGHATPCLGAAFLRNFICGDWIHMDITGVGKIAQFVAPPYLDPRRMTGRPCRTLIVLLSSIAQASQQDSSAVKEEQRASQQT